MSQYGIRIFNYEAASIYEYMNGFRGRLDSTKAMLVNSLFLDFLLEKKLLKIQNDFTHSIICLQFGYGTKDYSSAKQKLTEAMNREGIADKSVKHLEQLLSNLEENKDKCVRISKEDLRIKYYTEGVDITYKTFNKHGEEVVSTLALHSGCASAAVLADSEYTRFEKGMTIGVAGGIGGIFHNIGLRFINHDGFSTDDFTWLALDAGTLLAALQEGQVDAIIASDELIYNFVESGHVKIIRSQDYDPDFEHEVCCSLGFSKDFVEQNPVTVYKITRAVYRASVWLEASEENREKAVDLLLDKQYISCTREMGIELINLLHYGFGTEELVATTNVIGQEYKDLGILPADFDLSNAEDQFLVKYDLTKIN